MTRAFIFVCTLLLCLLASSLADNLVVETIGSTGEGKAFVSLNSTRTHDHHPARRAYSLAVNPTSGVAGSSFTATYTADDVTSTWIGVFASGSSSTSNFKYVTTASGSVTFSTAGLAAGTYNVYLVISTGYIQASATYKIVTTTATPSPTKAGPAPSPSSAPVGNAATWLSQHNTKRAAYGMPALQWSSNLQTSAQNYANSLASSSSCGLVHSGGQYGENLAKGYSSIAAVLNGWVDSEAQYYNPTTKTCSGGVCGHFTQVLWRMTSYVGCGIANCASGSPIYVCQYLRPGNCNGYDYTTTNSPCGPFGP